MADDGQEAMAIIVFGLLFTENLRGKKKKVVEIVMRPSSASSLLIGYFFVPHVSLQSVCAFVLGVPPTQQHF